MSSQSRLVLETRKVSWRWSTSGRTLRRGCVPQQGQPPGRVRPGPQAGPARVLTRLGVRRAGGAVSPEQACSLQQPHLPARGRAACRQLRKRPLQRKSPAGGTDFCKILLNETARTSCVLAKSPALWGPVLDRAAAPPALGEAHRQCAPKAAVEAGRPQPGRPQVSDPSRGPVGTH